jgi:hypothetical protein
VDLNSLIGLLAGPDQKILRLELLGRLRGGVVDLSNHTVAVGVNVDAELDGLGFRQVLCGSELAGIGVRFGFHTTLV